MGDITEVKALGRISSEVDESQIKIILSTQCIKAQTLLTDKLKKQILNQKQTCSDISSANLKLQYEILEAEQKIKSMLIAQQTIKMANVELNKELLLVKEKKKDIIDRIETGEKKYEALWLECKKRYESLPYVKVLLKTNEKADNVKKDISDLEEASLKLIKEIDNKTVSCSNIDKKRIIDMAEFIVNEVPKTMKIIEEKTKLIKQLTHKLKEYNNNKNLGNVKVQEKVETTNNNDFIMPELELPCLDFDMLSIRYLDQVNIKNANAYKINESKNEVKESVSKSHFKINMFQNNDTNDLMSSYFTKPVNYETHDTENYSKRKLINILEDMNVGKDEVLCMMSKVNREALQPVQYIGVEKNVDQTETTSKLPLEKKGKEPIQSDEIEEIDMTSTSRNDYIIFPPSQFLDITMTTAKENVNEMQDDETEELVNRNDASQVVLSQTREGITKKVSFDLPSQTDGPNDNLNENVKENDDELANQLDVSAVSDDGLEKIKDMVLKKHNLDLSPQFVYAKNTMLQKKTDDKVVTSKFFENKDNNTNVTDKKILSNANENDKEPAAEHLAKDNPIKNDLAGENKQDTKNDMDIDVNNDIPFPPSPKRQKFIDKPQSIKPVSGLLFSHGAQGIPDSLDVSISTTGFEDGDADFPHCIDSSLLLSPKADIPTHEDNPEGQSQEVPNFLMGLRKTGFSFFGRLPSSESKSDSNASNPGTSSGFSFNFGGEDKKIRGGLFSMFK